MQSLILSFTVLIHLHNFVEISFHHTILLFLFNFTKKRLIKLTTVQCCKKKKGQKKRGGVLFIRTVYQ